jgi:hypothetical protein
VEAVSIRAVEFVDHGGEKTRELALHVVGETPKQAGAIEALKGPPLIEIVWRSA